MFKKLFEAEGSCALVLFAALVLAPAVLLAAWDLAVFQPRKPAIAALLAQATPAERFPSPPIAALVRKTSGGMPSAPAARLLMSELSVPRLGAGRLGWHASALLWQTMVVLYLSEQQQIAVILSRSPMGQGVVGYAAAAQARFHKPLARLSMEEMAALAASGEASGS